MPAGVHGDPLHRRGWIVERQTVQMALERRLSVGREVENPPPLIDPANAVRVIVPRDLPLTARERSDQLAIPVVQIEMLKAAATRGPDEVPGACEKCQLIVQIDPGIAVLAQKLAGRTGRRIHVKQRQRLLVPALALDGQGAAVRKPADASEVDIEVAAKIGPDGRFTAKAAGTPALLGALINARRISAIGAGRGAIRGSSRRPQ